MTTIRPAPSNRTVSFSEPAAQTKGTTKSAGNPTDAQLAKTSGLPLDIIKQWPRDASGATLNACSIGRTSYYGNPACGPVTSVQF